jgi:hypothetical protein
LAKDDQSGVHPEDRRTGRVVPEVSARRITVPPNDMYRLT